MAVGQVTFLSWFRLCRPVGQVAPTVAVEYYPAQNVAGAEEQLFYESRSV